LRAPFKVSGWWGVVNIMEQGKPPPPPPPPPLFPNRGPNLKNRIKTLHDKKGGAPPGFSP